MCENCSHFWDPRSKIRKNPKSEKPEQSNKIRKKTELGLNLGKTNFLAIATPKPLS